VATPAPKAAPKVITEGSVFHIADRVIFHNRYQESIGIGSDFKTKNSTGFCYLYLSCLVPCCGLFWAFDWKKPSQYTCRGLWPLHSTHLTCCRSPLFYWCNTVKLSSKSIVDQWWLSWTQLLFYRLQTTDYSGLAETPRFKELSFWELP